MISEKKTILNVLNLKNRRTSLFLYNEKFSFDYYNYNTLFVNHMARNVQEKLKIFREIWNLRLNLLEIQ